MLTEMQCSHQYLSIAPKKVMFSEYLSIDPKKCLPRPSIPIDWSKKKFATPNTYRLIQKKICHAHF